jgi:hypothetical protein
VSTRSLLAIFTDITVDLSGLVRLVVSIFRLEMRDAVVSARNSILILVAGCAFCVGGGLTLICALVLMGVALGMSPWAAALAVGALMLIGGAVALEVSLGSLRRVHSEFPQTRGVLSESVEWLKTIRR